MSKALTQRPSAGLFDSYRLGALELPNRIVMAPLTRSRARHADNAPTEMNARYYAQRATAGLIVAEATQISQQGQGYAYTPGIYSQAQVAGWKLVTDAVHAANGRIYLQLWHVGRISHPSLQPGGALPVAPSAVQPKAQVYNNEGYVDCVTPRALRVDELPGIVEDFRAATRNALDAGFDGVEVHAANGYLLDEFLKDGPNRRTDEYGGSIRNRVRFPLEVIAAVAEIAGPARVGVRISPVSPAGDAFDSKPAETFGHFTDELNGIGVAYLHVIEGATAGPRDIPGIDYADLRRRFHGTYMANNGYTRELALETIASGRADLIAFGIPFLANPDLVERLARDAPLNAPDADTFYGGGERGYTDYPFLDAQVVTS
jgi:N-ethylmaleimide reductase